MAEAKHPYRVLKGKHGRWEAGKVKNYTPGDTMYLTEAEARRLTSATGSMVERIGTGAPAQGSRQPEIPETTTEPLGLAEMHWSKAAALIGELETVESVRAAKDEEAASKARKGVLQAADDRLSELEGS